MITGTAKLPTTRVELLDADSAAAMVRRLDRCSNHLIARGPGFYTFGAAAYLDACRALTPANYFSLAQTHNPLLAATFEDVYRRLEQRLLDLLGEPVHHTARLALPGFHLWQHCGLGRAYLDGFHIDGQFRHLGLAVESGASTLSFTLPLELPLSGGGIEFCHLSSTRKSGEILVEPYRVGELLVHSGLVLHRRHHVDTTTSCRRVTLQGHGYRWHGRWTLYW